MCYYIELGERVPIRVPNDIYPQRALSTSYLLALSTCWGAWLLASFIHFSSSSSTSLCFYFCLMPTSFLAASPFPTQRQPSAFSSFHAICPCFLFDYLSASSLPLWILPVRSVWSSSSPFRLFQILFSSSVVIAVRAFSRLGDWFLDIHPRYQSFFLSQASDFNIGRTRFFKLLCSPLRSSTSILLFYCYRL